MKIGVVGCAGRMGRTNLAEVLDTTDVTLAGAVEQMNTGIVGRDAGELVDRPGSGVAVGNDPVPLFAQADAVIDFTAPAATVEHAKLAAQAKTVLVVGTTGLSHDQAEEIHKAGRHAPIVWAANMSVGVTLLTVLAEQVGAALGESFDAEILEMHHGGKKDAPSGTALSLGRSVAAGRGQDFDSVAKLSREGQTGERPVGEIGFATLRGGDVVGEHSLTFAGAGERVTLGHVAQTRQIFARGALRAARWAQGQAPGVYSMRDVLGIGG